MASSLVFSAAEALDILRGAGLDASLRGTASASFSTASLDSRKAAFGSLFAAFRGDRADGHDFAISALVSGSR
ncbi:MAG TPA: hypothetical protein VMV44_06075, partial [Rectinemataceae bacterium]|nr:hypothetical protein [Rectinemataceae bacterium]